MPHRFSHGSSIVSRPGGGRKWNAVWLRLAAILAADVVGYSRLMEADEAETLASLKSHCENLIDPTVAKHNGRTTLKDGVGVLRVWRYGDGANYLPPKAGVKALRSND